MVSDPLGPRWPSRQGCPKGHAAEAPNCELQTVEAEVERVADPFESEPPAEERTPCSRLDAAGCQGSLLCSSYSVR